MCWYSFYCYIKLLLSFFLLKGSENAVGFALADYSRRPRQSSIIVSWKMLIHKKHFFFVKNLFSPSAIQFLFKGKKKKKKKIFSPMHVLRLVGPSVFSLWFRMKARVVLKICNSPGCRMSMSPSSGRALINVDSSYTVMRYFSWGKLSPKWSSLLQQEEKWHGIGQMIKTLAPASLRAWQV